MQSVVLPSSDNEMKYLLLVLVVCSVGILMIPNAFAVNERTIEVKNAPGSLVPGCEETNGCFLPDRQSIKPGDTIVWTNPDTMSHYVASGTSSGGKDGGFDSGMIAPGQTFEHQFTKSGLYNYFCSAHPWMEGIIIVEEGPDWVPPSTPSPPSSSTSKTPTNLILDPLPTTFKADYQPASGSTRATITFSGELETADKKFYITDAPITLKFIGFTLDGKNHYEITTDNKGLFNFAITLLPGNDYGIQAVFDGDTKFKSSKSQTEYFTVTLATSQPQPQPPTQSSGGFEWIWILIILGVVFAGVAAVLAKRNKKKTPIAPLAQQPKRRRAKTKPSRQYSPESASTFAHYECPNCHSENIVQNPDGSELCSDCGWKS